MRLGEMKHEWRLRTVLTAILVMVSLITFGIVGAAILALRLPQIEDANRQEVRLEAAGLMLLVEQVTDGLEARLKTLASLIRHPAAPDIQMLLDATAAEGGFDALYVVGADGRVTHVGLGWNASPTSLRGTDLSANPLFIGARGRSEPFWSDRYISAVSGSPTTGVAVQAGRHVLIGETSPQYLAGAVSAASRQYSNPTLVVDRRGERVADNKLSDKDKSYDWSEILRGWEAGMPATAERIQLAQGWHFLGAARSDKLNWTFLVLVPSGMANPRFSSTVGLVLFGIAASLLLAVALSPLWARLIAWPMQKVAEQTREIATGNYEKKVPRGHIRELNDLTTDLERMGSAVLDRQDALTRSEDRLRATLENTPSVAVQWFDAEGRVSYWNHASELFYGFAANEAVGNRLEQLQLVESDYRSFVMALRQIEQSGQAIGPQERRAHHKDGRELVVLSTLFAIPGVEGGLQFAAMDVDVTGRHTAAAALQESEQRFQSIFAASPLPIAVLTTGDDEEGSSRLIDVNEAWLAKFDRRREDVLGQALCGIDLWQSEELCRQNQRSMRGSREAVEIEAWLQRSDGYPVLCEMSTRPVTIGGRSLLIWVLNDITDKRVVEEELRQLNAELEARVDKRTQDLARANRELSAAMEDLKLAQGELVNAEKLAALGGLVAGVAHELNTPIGNGMMAVSTLNDDVRQFRQVMETGLKRSSLEAFVDSVGTATSIALRNLERAAELIASFKQVAVDQTSSQRRRFDLREVVEEILTTLHPMLKRTPYEIQLAVPPRLELDSFPGPFGQVLTNLINNAVIHGFEGRDHGRIEISAEEIEGGQIAICVRDDGRGFSTSMRHRVFEPFATTRRGQGGTGLGLHISYNTVVKLLGGQISMTSDDGKGTEFVITVPKVAPKPEDIA